MSSRTATFAQAHRGFTLIEVLVALAITSLVMTLLMSAVYYVFQIRSRMIEEVTTGETQIRQRLWFRQLVAGVQPVAPEEADRFEGDANGFRALFARGFVAADQPAPESARLYLDRDDPGVTKLMYASAVTQLELARWFKAKPRFRYWTQAGNAETAWNERLQPVERLPAAIELEIEYESGSTETWFARVESTPWLIQQALPTFLIPDAGKQP
jgi:prepilin-type N-terminal cleavage/methylation domain-containing protein